MNRRIAHALVVLSIAVTLVLTLAVVALSAQLEPVVPDIGFEIEGNTALDNGGAFDWENSPFPPAKHIVDPNSMLEVDPTVFLPNSKFDDPAGWKIRAGRVGPGQSELINFLVWDIKPGDLGSGRPGDHWLVLGMERIKVPGFFELDFEYNQAAWDGTSGGLTRTPGDVLVGFELKGKPTSKMAEHYVLLLQFWPGAQPSLCSTTLGPGGELESVEIGTEPCPPYGDSGWYYRLLDDDGLSASSGLVQATMNEDSFVFAEAAINLTALGIELDCSAPGSVHAKSRSAPHVHSDLKDLVGPVVLECEPARLDGHKFLDNDGDGLWDPDEPPLEGWEIRLSDGKVAHTDKNGYYAFENLAYGTYTVSEVCPQDEDWVQTAPPPGDPGQCGDGVYPVELDSGNLEVNDLDFGNRLPPEPPDLEVAKDVQSSYTRTYLWTLTKTVDNPGPILLYPGDYVEVEYTVVAESTYVDSDWAVEGTITIDNPGTADVVLASVTDVISPGGIAAPVECGTSVVPGLGSVTCTYGPVPLPDGSARTNTVTVMVQDSAEEWSASADIVFGDPTTAIDKEAQITDTNWEDEQWEGPEWVDVEDPGNAEDPIIYPWKIWTPGDECNLLDYPNTATLVTNDRGIELEASANVQILEVCEVTMAYEDLPLAEEYHNDWDYNDLVVHMPIALEVSESGNLETMSIEVTQEDVMSAFSHAFNFQPYDDLLSCGGTYIKTVTRGVEVTYETGDYDPGDNFLLIPNTTAPADLIELRIDFDVAARGACPHNLGAPDPVDQYHGEWLFFDPWLTVYNTGEEIHVLQPPAVEPRILTVPVDWVHPPEGVPIWQCYPLVQEGNPPVFVPYWWEEWNEEQCGSMTLLKTEQTGLRMMRLTILEWR